MSHVSAGQREWTAGDESGPLGICENGRGLLRMAGGGRECPVTVGDSRALV